MVAYFNCGTVAFTRLATADCQSLLFAISLHGAAIACRRARAPSAPILPFTINWTQITATVSKLVNWSHARITSVLFQHLNKACAIFIAASTGFGARGPICPNRPFTVYWAALTVTAT